MEAQTKHTLEQVLVAIQEGHTKKATADVLGCSRNTVLNYCRRWQTVADAFESQRREMVDLAETGLRSALEKCEPWAVTFTLKTLGKDEGYSERHEVTGKDGATIFTLKLGDDGSNGD